MLHEKFPHHFRKVSLGTLILTNLLGSTGNALAWHTETHKPIEDMQHEAKPVADLAKRVYEAVFDAYERAPNIIKVKEWGDNIASIGYEVRRTDKTFGVYADARQDSNLQPTPEKLSKYLPIKDGYLLTLFIPYKNDSRIGQGNTLLDKGEDGIVVKFLIGRDYNLIYNISDSKAGFVSRPSGVVNFDIVIGERLEGLSEEQRKYYLSILEAHLQLFMAELNKAVQEAQPNSPKILR